MLALRVPSAPCGLSVLTETAIFNEDRDMKEESAGAQGRIGFAPPPPAGALGRPPKSFVHRLGGEAAHLVLAAELTSAVAGAVPSQRQEHLALH